VTTHVTLNEDEYQKSVRLKFRYCLRVSLFTVSHLVTSIIGGGDRLWNRPFSQLSDFGDLDLDFDLGSGYTSVCQRELTIKRYGIIWWIYKTVTIVKIWLHNRYWGPYELLSMLLLWICFVDATTTERLTPAWTSFNTTVDSRPTVQTNDATETAGLVIIHYSLWPRRY